MFKKISALSLLVILLSGCSHQAGGIAASTSPIAVGSYQTLGQVKGEDCVYALLGIIPLSNGNETRKAIQDAISKKRGATDLIEVTSDTYSQFFVIASRTCTQVYGTAIVQK